MLERLAPGFVVRWFARRYVAGGSLQEGLETAAGLAERRVLASLDLLGEDVHRPEQIRRNVAVYERVIAAVAADPRLSLDGGRTTVSLKPSAFTAESMAAAAEPIRALAERCREAVVPLTLDMEDRRWTDWTLDLALELFGRGLDVGAVLQTRLHRTEQDVERIPEGMRIRLVIGIYPEPAAVALTRKRSMKERLVEYAARLLERGARVEFASHDEEFLRRFLGRVAPRAPERCEVQMLLGVPRWEFIRRLQRGEFGPALPVRLYIPFALDWEEATVYLRRRMSESPGIGWLVLRNLMRRRGA
ncbi:MAG: proline dehydrogenase family protein [Planctomycetota bacterium]